MKIISFSVVFYVKNALEILPFFDIPENEYGYISYDYIECYIICYFKDPKIVEISMVTEIKS